MNETRIVIDTGVVVSAALLPNSVPRQAFNIAVSCGKVLVSDATIAELDDVLRRTKFNRYVPEERRLEFLKVFVEEAEEVEVAAKIVACRDDKDNKFLELAVSGRASHILTGDRDLLALHPFQGIAVLTPQAFLTSIPCSGTQPVAVAVRSHESYGFIMSHQSLIQFNTRVTLNELGRSLGRRATLDDLPDAFLDRFAAEGFDWVWPLGVWQTGAEGRRVSRTREDWRRDFLHVLPDLTDDDICGSPFAITAYELHTDFGNSASLPRLRERLKKRGLKLLLDFVPNHSGPDHPWTKTNPEFYIRGSADDLAREPQNWYRLPPAAGGLILAYGRDPYFPGWADTLQFNYRHPALRAAKIGELLKIAERCDAVRCDMAMLVLPEVFQNTWGTRSLPADGSAPVDAPFWAEAISRVKQARPGFVFMAEAYWDLEFRLQQQGFDYTYDKRLYDRLRVGYPGPIRGHLYADAEYQRKSVRFLENHDEPRAAGVFPPEQHRAAAVTTFFVPGLRFFHEGQFEGRRVHVSMHLGRRPVEPVDAELQAFYGRVLECLKRPEVRAGQWTQREVVPAWDGNPTWDQFIAFTWDGALGKRLLACIHYGSTQGQCYVRLPLPDLLARQVELRDLLSTAIYTRFGDDLNERGLFLDMPPWGYHLFEMVTVKK